jgi:uncharacterized membrane protein YccC
LPSREELVDRTMNGITQSAGNPLLQPGLPAAARRLARAMRAAGPPLLFGLRLWASVSLALYLAFWLQLDNPYWAGGSAAIVCQPQLGASLRKGWFRMVGTLIGATMCIVLVACFPQQRVLFFVGLALWSAVCAFVATLLRNFASYAAALSGYTVAIVGGGLLGATGGVDANAAFLFAVARATEIWLGIVCAGVVLAGTDLGGARRRLTAQFAELSTRIAAGFAGALVGGEPASAQAVRRELLRRVIGLDPILDQTIGESSQIRYHSPVLQSAVDGLFAALAAWRAVANHLMRAPRGEPQPETSVVNSIPPELRSAELPGAPSHWMATPTALRELCAAAARRLIALPAGAPSVRLLAEQAADAFAGISRALDGLALLVDDMARPTARRGSRKWASVVDWLPALVNGGRAFIVISTVALFWVVTGWPGGSNTITFAGISILLLGSLGDNAYAGAVLFTMGSILDMVITAIVKFAVLPVLGTETFVGFSLVILPCLVAIGALLAQARRPWEVPFFTGMTIAFVPVLAPTNPISYNLAGFYNTTLTIVAGSAAAALSFRLVPPLSPAYRARRLLASTLRSLRRLAAGHDYRDWDAHIQARLVAMPDTATPLQRAQLLAALPVGREIIRLRNTGRPLYRSSGTAIEAALAAISQGHSAVAIGHLIRLDGMLAAAAGSTAVAETVLRTRAGILALTEALADHAVFFDGETADAVH